MAIEQGIWQSLGRCNSAAPKRGAIPDMFPNTAEGRIIAKKFCQPCTVLVQCLEDALTEEIQIGVRGGKSEGERSRILAKRNK